MLAATGTGALLTGSGGQPLELVDVADRARPGDPGAVLEVGPGTAGRAPLGLVQAAFMQIKNPLRQRPAHPAICHPRRYTTASVVYLLG
ncbi:hypothetical protein Sgou_00600 [Streptomyces gougerotii]|uniref:Uncharacterized protein n=1 Tax=Streptomyces gougerotii TaxID=53448 RepID=A0ABQ1CYK5_9ACTN|nr:hypothetical protein Sgou_00600 [Streptomyces gougerotii]